jgi:hypothetical protein
VEDDRSENEYLTQPALRLRTYEYILQLALTPSYNDVARDHLLDAEAYRRHDPIGYDDNFDARHIEWACRDLSPDLGDLALIPLADMEAADEDVIGDAISVYERLLAVSFDPRDGPTHARAYLEAAHARREHGATNAIVVADTLHRLDEDNAPTLGSLAL